MARTYRRPDQARRLLALQERWARHDESVGQAPFTYSPAWRLTADAFGSDSKKKGQPIKTHRRSIRRFVRDTLATGREPVVLNDKQSWFCRDNAVGIVLDIDSPPVTRRPRP